MLLLCGMWWTFIRPSDIAKLMQPEEMLRLVDLDAQTLTDGLDTAIVVAKSYLNLRYDLEIAMPKITSWNETKTYTKGDLVTELPNEWDAGANYVAFDLVHYKGFVFEAIAANTNEAPASRFRGTWHAVLKPVYSLVADSSTNEQPSTYDQVWKANEGRNPLLITLLADLAIYDLMSRAMPDAVPELRTDRKKAALEMLSRIAAGKQSIDLPLLTTNKEAARRTIVRSTGTRYNWD